MLMNRLTMKETKEKFKMRKDSVKKNMKELRNKAMAATSGAVAFLFLNVMPAFAAPDTSAITKPLDTLKTLVIAIIGAIGVIILAKNVMEFAQAYQQQDSSTMNSALKGIVAGVIMASISTVLTLLGF